MGIPQLHQAKVHQRRPPIRAQKNVLGLDVAVHDALTVAIDQSIEQLPGPNERLGFGRDEDR